MTDAEIEAAMEAFAPDSRERGWRDAEEFIRDSGRLQELIEFQRLVEKINDPRRKSARRNRQAAEDSAAD